MNEKAKQLLKPSYLKELCEKYSLRPSKSYGQNYLVQYGPIEAMLEAGSITKEDTVVEVGPGFGILTYALAESAKQVISFEIEQVLKPYWEENKPDNVEIIWGDALKQLAQRVAEIDGPYKIIANVPYQITSKLLRTFFELDVSPVVVVVMVQKEVAERIIAGPGDMSLLSTSVQFYGSPSIAKKVAKGSFWPSPKVNSAVLAITDIQKQQNSEHFFEVVRAAYAQKRKQAWKNISKGLHIDGEGVKSILEDVTGNQKIRAEEISVEQWKTIVERIKN